MRWRILSIDNENGTIKLISETPTHSSVGFNFEQDTALYAAELDAICEYLYGGTNVVSAGNLAVEDFEFSRLRDANMYLPEEVNLLSEKIRTLLLGNGSSQFYYDNGMYRNDKEGEYWYGSWIVSSHDDVGYKESWYNDEGEYYEAGWDGSEILCVDDGYLTNSPSFIAYNFNHNGQEYGYASLRPVVVLSSSAILGDSKNDGR